jgi:transposase
MKILALDLGKSKTVGCLLDTEGTKESYHRIRTVPVEVCILVNDLRPDRVVFEVGTSAGWIHDVVAGCGVKDIQVANPNHEGWRWRNVKRKTDRLDALKLARLSAMDQLPTVYIPQARTREHRALIAYRCKLVSRRTRIKNTIRSLLHRVGRRSPVGQAGWTGEAIGRLRSMARPLEACEAQSLWRGQLQEELDALEEIERRLRRVEKSLDALARGDERISRLRTIPCVGVRTAEMLVAVIDDPHRFGSGKEVGSYVGLVPRQYQSGQTNRQGHISKQGHRQLRQLLVEVSWLALRYNRDLAGVYERICGGSRSRRKVAIVAVARKLLIIAWAMLRDGSCWRGRRVAVA